MSTGACSLPLDRGVVVSSWFTCCVSCDMSRKLCDLAVRLRFPPRWVLSRPELLQLLVRCILRLAVQLELDLPHSTRRGCDSGRLCQSLSTWSLRAVRSKELVEGLLSRHPLDVVASWSHSSPCWACAGFSSLSPCAVFTLTPVTSLHSATGGGPGFHASPSRQARWPPRACPLHTSRTRLVRRSLMHSSLSPSVARSMNSSFVVDVATDCRERDLDLDLSRADFRRPSRSFASSARSFSACSLVAASAERSLGTCCVSSPSSCSLSALACCNLRSPSLRAPVAVCSLVLAFSTFACAAWTAFCSF